MGKKIKMVRMVLCAVGTAAVCTAIAADSPVLTDVCVFRGGQAIGGRANNVVRIPALVQSGNGDLVAVADARPWTGDDLRFGKLQPIRVVVSRSTDGGKTWTTPVFIDDPPWNETEKWAIGDPSLARDASTGKLFCFYNAIEYLSDGLWADGSEKACGPVNGHGKMRFFVQESSDHGKTWSKPREFTKDLYLDEWEENHMCFIPSGSGTQLKDGTLLHLITWLKQKGSDQRVHAFGSRDHGKTWMRFGDYATNADEAKIVGLPDGRWMINSRPIGASRARGIHLSDDAGKTWSFRSEPALVDPQCNGGFAVEKKAHGRFALYCSHCKDEDDRKNLTVSGSGDGGKTWKELATLEKDTAGYSDLAIIDCGDLGVLFEGPHYGKIRFARVSRMVKRSLVNCDVSR